MSLLDELISKFRSGDIVTRLVFINCAVFLAMLLMDINFTLFSFGEDRYGATTHGAPICLSEGPGAL